MVVLFTAISYGLYPGSGVRRQAGAFKMKPGRKEPAGKGGTHVKASLSYHGKARTRMNEPQSPERIGTVRYPLYPVQR
jgi:hypothetical protein